MAKWKEWQREIDNEKDPSVKAFLQRSYDEQVEDMRGRSKGRKPKLSKAAIAASIEWQKP